MSLSAKSAHSDYTLKITPRTSLRPHLQVVLARRSKHMLLITGLAAYCALTAAVFDLSDIIGQLRASWASVLRVLNPLSASSIDHERLCCLAVRPRRAARSTTDPGSAKAKSHQYAIGRGPAERERGADKFVSTADPPRSPTVLGQLALFRQPATQTIFLYYLAGGGILLASYISCATYVSKDPRLLPLFFHEGCGSPISDRLWQVNLKTDITKHRQTGRSAGQRAVPLPPAPTLIPHPRRDRVSCRRTSIPCAV